jgi:hypothetical protein
MSQRFSARTLLLPRLDAARNSIQILCEKADFDRIKAGIEAFRREKRRQQQERAEIKTILRENREAHRNLYAILRLRGFKL